VDGQVIYDQNGASEMTLRACGIDQAKTVFQMHGVNLLCEPSLRKQMRRTEVLMYFVKLKACLIGMEVYGGASTGP